MTVARVRRAGLRRPVPLRRPDPVHLVFAAILLAAFLIRLRLLTNGVGLTASDDYDDGVYYAAADALVHGRLPYRDFLLVHPPGILIALAPFAALGALVGDPVGVATARLAFMAIGTTGVGLVMVLAGRHSRGAAVVAGSAAACWFPLAFTERSTTLEPLGGCLVLAAVVLSDRAGRRSAVLAGALAGLAIMVKVWYVVPLVVLVIFLRGRRLRLLAGATGAMIAVGLPFLFVAPQAMVRQVVLDQLGRSRVPGADLGLRFTTVLGVPSASTGPEWPTIVLGAVLIGAVALAARRPWARIHVAQLLGALGLLLVVPSFFRHYGAFTAPWAAICIGVGGATACALVRRRWVRTGALALLCAVLVAAGLPADLRTTTRPQPIEQLRPLLAAHRGCVVSDDPGLLANVGVLSRDLARGCPLWPDVTGWTYDRDLARDASGRILARERNPLWQQHLLEYLQSGDLVIVVRSSTGLSPASKATIDALPVVGRAGALVVHRTR